MLHTLVSIIIQAIDLLIIGRIIISFIPSAYNNPIGRFIYDTSEPILAPIRRILPDTGMIDFSPLVLFIILDLIRRFFYLNGVKKNAKKRKIIKLPAGPRGKKHCCQNTGQG